MIVVGVGALPWAKILVPLSASETTKRHVALIFMFSLAFKIRVSPSTVNLILTLSLFSSQIGKILVWPIPITSRGLCGTYFRHSQTRQSIRVMWRYGGGE